MKINFFLFVVHIYKFEKKRKFPFRVPGNVLIGKAYVDKRELTRRCIDGNVLIGKC